MLARASAGETLTLTGVKAGSGTVSSETAAKALTGLVSVECDGTSSAPAVSGGQVSMIVEIRNDVEGGLDIGFLLSEFGVFAKVGDDQPALLYYAALGDGRAQQVLPLSEGLDIHRFPVAIAVTGEIAVTLGYPAGAFVTQEELEAALAQLDMSGFVQKAGDTMTGPLVLPGDPTASLQAAPKQYVDALRQLLVQKAGDTMTGPLVLPGNPTANLQAAPKQYIDSVASTLNTALASRARIQTGSYVGTGTYGSSNPCSLTFDFMPQLFILFGKANSNANYRNMIIAIKGGTQLAFTISSGSNPAAAEGSNVGLTFSWGSSTLNWYATNLNYQLNASGVTYNWLAAGT